MVHHPAHPTPPELRHWTLPELLWARDQLIEHHKEIEREREYQDAQAKMR